MEEGWRSWEGYTRPPRNGRSPHPPGSCHSAIPSWEKRFCTSVCLIPWARICAAKATMSAYKNVVEWDDSAALEAFQNAKARYWAEINGCPCDIPLPDPDIFIDKVDHKAIIDPKLVEDLEKKPPPPPDGNNDASNGWDSFIFADKPVPVTGWGDAEDDNAAEHRSVNWDVFIEKPLAATGWGDAEEPVATKGDSSNAWNCHSGWGDGNVQNGSWGGGGNNLWDNGRDNSWGPHWDNWNNEQVRRNGRKRNGGHYGSRFSRSRHQVNNYQTNCSNWKDCKQRSMADYPYEKTMHAGQPMATRQWKSQRSCGPMNHQRSSESGGAWHWGKSVI